MLGNFFREARVTIHSKAIFTIHSRKLIYHLLDNFWFWHYSSRDVGNYGIHPESTLGLNHFPRIIKSVNYAQFDLGILRSMLGSIHF